MVKIRFIALSLSICLLAACAPSAQAIQTAIARTQSVWTKVPTQTAYPTQTPYPTQTAVPTFAITVVVTEIVTPTFTFTPLFTPTITNTPSKTSIPTPTLDPLKAPKVDGNYLVGVDIAPGIWRNDSNGNDCYWSRLTRTGEIIDNYIGAGKGTTYIAPTDFAFYSERCGTWTYLSPP
jgi:hypothetical protein